MGGQGFAHVKRKGSFNIRDGEHGEMVVDIQKMWKSYDNGELDEGRLVVNIQKEKDY